jgi:DNA-binding MarR family transcriptional regulator
MASPTSAIDRAQVAARLRLAVTRLNRHLGRQGNLGLTPTAQSALAAVVGHGPLSLGELADHEGVKPPTITATVAGLEAQGLIRREPDPTDRRVVRIAATQRGRLWLLRSRTRKTEYLARRLEALGELDLARLEAGLEVLEQLLEEGRA